MRNSGIAIALIAAIAASGCATRSGGAQAGEAAASETNGAGLQSASAADFAQTAGERVFFEYDQWSLSSQARETLRRQAQWLERHPGVGVLVAGHCDERGTREYNLALGARRAAAVRDFLIGLGVDARRIETTSYGKDRPLDPRSNAEGWAVNRNAHTQIVRGAVS